ncbi:MAG: FAD-dependent oxidoreductase [Ruminococcaceae bacterium]|nr:FAD-dependent oxidoreductase [Oscillospiraceae bacterium]
MANTTSNKKIHEYTADICVIGGGFAGMCAAISAARHGRSVVIIHDRPVFGGNASSEVRMWPMGAHGKNRRETGLFEEIILNNMHRNPTRNYPIWDSVLFEAVRMQEGITSLLNCTVMDAEMKDEKTVGAVYGWQMTTYRNVRVCADIFIDCSGDSILAELTGAEYRFGREARGEFNEAAAPVEADRKTMGNSCLLQVRETPVNIKYTPPTWARILPDEEQMATRPHAPDQFRDNNFWWMELGGTQDTIEDAEEIRDELLKLSFGVWDHIKNRGDHNADKWELEWAGFLPGKRESRRYVGDHILTQSDVQSGGKFDDIIAFGGWQIDDHPPAGFDHKGEPTTYYDCPSPFGIPYRCLYSKNIDNLMFAGRNISVTHVAMAASRVMGTCAMLGQAAGTAAALAVEKNTSPRGVNEYMNELQRRLMNDDCWLPGLNRRVSDECRNANLIGNSVDRENLRNGIDRPTDENGDNGCNIALGDYVEYTSSKPFYVGEVHLVFDSDLNRETLKGGIQEICDCPTVCNRPLNMEPYTFPSTMTKGFKLIADGETVFETSDNHRRLVKLKIDKTVTSLALVPTETYGSECAHVFSFDF